MGENWNYENQKYILQLMKSIQDMSGSSRTKMLSPAKKLDGTNVKLKTENGRLISLMNRKNLIDPLQIMKGKTFIIEGVFRAIQKGYIESDGVQAGEVIGPKLQGNPYRLDNHIWYPFEKPSTFSL